MTLLDRYQAVADKINVLPDDKFIAEQWRCNEVTPARMRSKLTAMGYGFTKRNGVWHVTKRPSMAGPTAARPAAPERPGSNGTGAIQQLVMTVSEPAPLVAPESTGDRTAAQLALIHQDLVTLNGLLAAHFQSRNEANRWEIAADSAW